MNRHLVPLSSVGRRWRANDLSDELDHFTPPRDRYRSDPSAYDRGMKHPSAQCSVAIQTPFKRDATTTKV